MKDQLGSLPILPKAWLKSISLAARQVEKEALLRTRESDDDDRAAAPVQRHLKNLRHVQCNERAVQTCLFFLPPPPVVPASTAQSLVLYPFSIHILACAEYKHEK